MLSEQCDVENTLADLSALKGKVEALRVGHDLVLKSVKKWNAMYDEACENRDDLDRVRAIIQYAASSCQNAFGDYIGFVVTEAMRHVFDDRKQDTFNVRFRENRGRIEAQLVIVNKDGEMSHPYDNSGGGVWDVLSFALRCAMLVLQRPERTKLLVLDEPFKFLHGSEQRTRALNMARNVCERLGVQTIIVHQGDESDDDSLNDVKSDSVSVYSVEKVGYEKSSVKKVSP